MTPSFIANEFLQFLIQNSVTKLHELVMLVKMSNKTNMTDAKIITTGNFSFIVNCSMKVEMTIVF